MAIMLGETAQVLAGSIPSSWGKLFSFCSTILPVSGRKRGAHTRLGPTDTHAQVAAPESGLAVQSRCCNRDAVHSGPLLSPDELMLRFCSEVPQANSSASG